MLIRKAKLEDVAGIAKVHVDSWRTTYKGIVPDSFLESLSYEGRQIVRFTSGGEERTGKYDAYRGELYAIYLLEGLVRNSFSRSSMT